MLENFSLNYKNYIENKQEASIKALYFTVIKFDLDSQLIQDWIDLQEKDNKM